MAAESVPLGSPAAPPAQFNLVETPTTASGSVVPSTNIEAQAAPTAQLNLVAPAAPSAQLTPVVWPEQFKHKNRLQQYAQRSAMPLPSYHTVNEGGHYGPMFRSTVLVDGIAYQSPQTFKTRKEAEQSVARLALESILKKIKDEGCPMIQQDTTFCKSILNEFAAKVSLEMPTYTSTRSQGLLPTFIATLIFNGRAYNGEAGRSKKEAEQLAARAVIQHFLAGGNEAGKILSEIIKSKSKLFEAIYRAKGEPALQIIPCPQNDALIATAVPGPDPPVPDFKKPKLEPSCEATTSLTENVTQVVDQSQFSVQPAVAGMQSASASTIIGKKRSRKNKKKGAKKPMVVEQLPAAVQHVVIQSPSCSVAQ